MKLVIVAAGGSAHPAGELEDGAGQVEYAELLAERKLYPDYTAARKEMRDLTTARTNVDRLAA